MDVYEAKSVPGGMAATGIPEYLLPNSVLNAGEKQWAPAHVHLMLPGMD